mgnify:CR=1 FL=1
MSKLHSFSFLSEDFFIAGFVVLSKIGCQDSEPCSFIELVHVGLYMQAMARLE